MKNITLTIRDVSRLNQLQSRLATNRPISMADKAYLAEFLSQIPTHKSILLEKIDVDETLRIKAWDMSVLETDLGKWQKLLSNLPGWDYCPFCMLVDEDSPKLLEKSVLIVAFFAPSYSYNTIRTPHEGYELWLKDDGTALFQLPTLEDAEQYPELYNFKGSWKEAYYLLIETLKKGWPMEEFPEELLPLLKK